MVRAVTLLYKLVQDIILKLKTFINFFLKET